MKITNARAIPMSDPVPEDRQHRIGSGTKVKSDAVLTSQYWAETPVRSSFHEDQRLIDF